MVGEQMMTASNLELDGPAGPRAELIDPAVTVRFMLAGNAHVTFQSRRTGTRFTYRVELAPLRTGAGVFDKPPHFVSVLTGSDHYDYLGCVYSGRVYAHGRKSRIALDAPSAIAFTWVWRTLTGGKMHDQLAVYHEGRCGRCGRRLTDPLSISRGMGSSCWERSGA